MLIGSQTKLPKKNLGIFRTNKDIKENNILVYL